MLTIQQRQLRRGLIGGSDAPAIVGVDPYKTAADVWAVHRGLVSIEENENMRRGSVLEPALLNFAESEIGMPLVRDVMLVHSDGMRCSNLDGIVIEAREFQEIKTSKVTDGWGDPFTDEVPDRVKIQVAQAFDCADDHGIELNVCRVVALLAMDIVTYFVPRDDELIEAVRNRVQSFHRNELQSEYPPEHSEISLDLLKRINRIPEKIVSVDPALVKAWRDANEKRLEWEKLEDAAKSRLIASLDDAEAGQFDGGLVTYFPTTRKTYEVKELTYRTLKFKKAKAGTGG